MPPTPAAFVGAWAKLKRANKHLKEFDGLADAFRLANKDFIGRQHNTQTHRRSYYLTRDPVVPDDYPLLVGDVLQCLRSALDHVAFALCVAGQGGASGLTDQQVRAIQFPISRGDANSYKGNPARAVVLALSKPGVEKALDATEPYMGGAGELLCLLSALNNADKHRLLVTIALQTPGIDASRYMADLFEDRMEAALPGITKLSKQIPLIIKPAVVTVLKAGDEIFNEPVDAKPNKEVYFTFPVALNEPQILPVQPVVEVLQKMANLVGGLIPAFDSFV